MHNMFKEFVKKTERKSRLAMTLVVMVPRVSKILWGKKSTLRIHKLQNFKLQHITICVQQNPSICKQCKDRFI